MAPSARSLALLALLALAPASACLPQQPRTPLTSDAVALLVDAKRAGIAIEDPSVMDSEMRRAMDEDVGRGGSPRERIERLTRWLHGGDHAFVHDPTLTVDARTSFRERRGGCMAHAILFVTLARYLGVEAYYVHALTAREFADRGEGLVAMTHVAVGYEDASVDRVVDVWIPVDDWRLVRYARIDDTSALALYYSNLAVEDMRGGRLADAERLLRFLSARSKEVAETSSNLAAVLVRQRRFAEALVVVREAIARFPSFKPLYTNGYLAAVGAGDEPLAEELAARGRELIDDDPIFLVARGVSDYERGRFAQAVKSFERARSDKKDSVVIHAWLVRAYVAAGDARSGAQAFERAWSLAPNDPRLARLAEEHPELMPLLAR
ncbi:MAG TPA: tetratricopeptide repeat protein [Labilithrix sp.]|nr:tetratricopeptide repeat protein [Labilithrix sp.]